MLFCHPLPSTRIAVLEGKTLGVWAVAQDHRIAAFRDRAKHVGTQHKAVVHGDLDVPIDAHAIASLTARLVRPARCNPRHAGFAFERRHRFPPDSFYVSVPSGLTRS